MRASSYNVAVGHFLDLDRWKRGQHFDHYRRMAQPFFSVCVDVDVTASLDMCRREGRSFFLVSLHCVLRAANETSAMRLRMRGDRVWLHDSVRISSTVMRDDETFGFARLAPTDDREAFEREGVAEIERVRRDGTLLPDDDDAVIYHSTLPWLRFTAFSNALPLGEDSIPRVVFGRYSQDGSRWRMPVAVEVHHALVDGIDVARFIERFENHLAVE